MSPENSRLPEAINNLRELRDELSLLFGICAPAVPRTWLTKTTRADLDYLKGVVGIEAHPFRLYFNARSFWECCLAPLPDVVELIRESVGAESRSRFVWLFLKVYVVQNYRRLRKEASVYSPDDVAALCELEEAAEILRRAYETPRRSAEDLGSPRAEIGALLRGRYRGIVRDLGALLTYLREESTVWDPHWTKQDREYPTHVKLALLAMEELLELPRNSASKYLYRLFADAGVILGDPDNPDPEKAAKSLRRQLYVWEKHRSDWLKEMAATS